jgi:hypothetical protein
MQTSLLAVCLLGATPPPAEVLSPAGGDCTAEALAQAPADLTLEAWASQCQAKVAANFVPTTTSLNARAEDAETSAKSSSSFSGIVSMWLHKHVPVFSSNIDDAKLDSYFAKSKQQLSARPASVLGGSMLRLPGFTTGLAAAFGAAVSRVPASAAPQLVKFVQDTCDDVVHARAYHETARRYPQLATLQAAMVRRLGELPQFKDHPEFAQLSSRFLALGNTTDTKPYAEPLPTSFLEQFRLW